jgi:hypothetical protein
MHYLWSGTWPAHRSPRLEGAWLDGKTARENVRLRPGHTYTARVRAGSAEKDTLTYAWEVREESTERKVGGDAEARTRSLPDLIANPASSEIVLKAPGTPGAYRLFAYVHDNKGHAAHVNIPFYVDQPAEEPLTAVSR